MNVAASKVSLGIHSVAVSALRIGYEVAGVQMGAVGFCGDVLLLVLQWMECRS